MRLEKIDYALLAMLAASLLYAAFKLIVVYGLSESSSERSFAVENGRGSEEVVMVEHEARDLSAIEQRLMQLEKQSLAAQDSRAVEENKKRQMASTTPLKIPPQESRFYDLVYSMQVGVFKTAEEVVAFAHRNPDVNLYCRKKDNGYWGSYYGAYDSYSDAKSHLQDNALLERVGAYVVKLSNTRLAPCLGLLGEGE